MPEGQETTERCSGCGLVVRGGTAGCQAIMDDLLARDFSNVAYFRVHRMMVDTYCLQHPERYCVSAKSLAAHLTGLCWLIVSRKAQCRRRTRRTGPRGARSTRGALGTFHVGGLFGPTFVGPPLDSAGARWPDAVGAQIGSDPSLRVGPARGSELPLRSHGSRARTWRNQGEEARESRPALPPAARIRSPRRPRGACR